MNANVKKYWSKYKWSNVSAMIKNMRLAPKQTPEPFCDRLVVITGATSGIGYRTARKYAEQGAEVLMINRNAEKSEAVCSEIRNEFGATISYFIADLARLSEIQRAAEHLLSLPRPIDVLIHNAGVHQQTRHENVDGLEENFAIHVLCPLIITKMLLPKYQRDQTGRILLVSSEGYRFAAWGLDLDDLEWKKRHYTGNAAYGAGKLAQLLFMHLLAPELAPSHVTINAMHPGMVRTETGKNNSRFYKWYKKTVIDKLSASADVSAEALYYLGTSAEISQTTDHFFHLTMEEELAPPAQDIEAANALLIKTRAYLEYASVLL